jgi:predicted ATPase/DNA-binding SARP family transcriptional activator
MGSAAGHPPGGRIAVDVIGPLRLVVAGEDVPVPGTKRRAVLALLAMAAPEPMGVDSLIDAVWPAELPGAARQALQSHASRIRRHLGRASTRLTAAGAGYRLALEPGELDADRFGRLVGAARDVAQHDARGALRLLREARALWRGPALDEFGDVAPLVAWARRLAELRLDADDLLVECALAAGDGATAVAIAGDSVAAEPLREAGVLHLMRALAAAGRAAEALRVGHDYRDRLGEESGLEPSRALSELEHGIAAGSVETTTARAVLPRAEMSPVAAPPSELVGREAELAGLIRLLQSERVVTIVGPGGVGKTHLALEAARHAGVHGSVCGLALAPVSDAAGVPGALATALGLRVPADDALAASVERLRSGVHLLLVDNCEHVLDAARSMVAALVATCPELTILATSRERLGLPAEQTCPLMPLPMPAAGRGGGVGDVPSVALFVERARRVRPGFTPDDADQAVIADVVRRLDGMPLAIELAAGRLSSMGLADVRDRLDRALDLLGSGNAIGESRHRSLRAAIEWSYELLPHDERRLFRSLAVFPDGFDLSTAEDLARALGCSVDPATAIAHLVDASMLVVSFDPTRYRMLDTLRSFAIDQLDVEGEREAAAAFPVEWAVLLAQWVDATIRTERESDADAKLRAELQNLHEAWRTARAQGDLDAAAALVVSLDEAAAWRDLSEIWAWARELADDPRLADHPAAAMVLGVAADAAWMGAGDLDASEALAARGLELARQIDPMGEKRCIAALSDIASFRGDHDRARTLALECEGGPREFAPAVAFAALSAAYGGDPGGAAELMARAAPAAPTAIAFSTYVAAEIESLTGAWAEAERHYREAIELATRVGATFVEGVASVGLVSVLAASGRIEDALVGYRDLVDYWERVGAWTQQWTTLRNLASLLDDLGDTETASFLRHAADQAPESAALHTPVRPEPVSPASDALLSRQRVLTAARDAIDRARKSPISVV